MPENANEDSCKVYEDGSIDLKTLPLFPRILNELLPHTWEQHPNLIRNKLLMNIFGDMKFSTWKVI